MSDASSQFAFPSLPRRTARPARNYKACGRFGETAPNWELVRPDDAFPRPSGALQARFNRLATRIPAYAPAGPRCVLSVGFSGFPSRYIPLDPAKSRFPVMRALMSGHSRRCRSIRPSICISSPDSVFIGIFLDDRVFPTLQRKLPIAKCPEWRRLIPAPHWMR